MAKQLNQVQVNLQFTADTKQAKQQLEGLQQTLNNLVRNPSGNLDKQMAAASKSAAELAGHLKAATNADTGVLDFSKLNQSIQRSGKTLQQYGDQLLSLGPDGKRAFAELATAISNSEIPMRRVNKSLQEMGTVLKNTIRWQLSSSAIHAFQGAIQGAYRYAQDLNKSLNDIRIVTGQSAEQMEKFAERANRAAKNLSSTTLDYTNASLIYYQQGLSDEEVEARTNVTIKMANAAGESAEKVSSQLTAVWNNFAKGGENLEYYADVMTALGAATASSTDEISQGLEKFASVADTVGLSYEYAAAALATVTATTRQSADVVGNAFKTLFARLEGLKLGETLDDGTDLNKYSKALDAVGVSIKDTDGELRNMDNILDDLAGKWQNLSKDQKMALAQTVAGVRQYTQLIALMDQWDFMQSNVNIARNASGTLQKQADIYAESWQAAQKRVQAALETLYQALLKDNFFISLLDGTEKAINGVNGLIKAFGGIPGILSTIGSLVTSIFGKQMAEELRNIAYTIQNLLPGGYEKQVAQRDEMLQNAINGLPQSEDYSTRAEDIEGQALRQNLEITTKLAQAKTELNDLEYTTLTLLAEQTNTLKQQQIERAKELDTIELEISKLKEQASTAMVVNGPRTGLGYKDLNEAERGLQTAIEKFHELEQAYVDIQARAEQGLISEDAINRTEEEIRNTHREIEQLIGSINELTGTQNAEVGYGQQLAEGFRQLIPATENYKRSVDQAKASRDNFDASSEKSSVLMQDWASTVMYASQVITSFSAAANSLKGLGKILEDETLSPLNKTLSFMTSFSSGIFMLIRGFTALSKAAINLQISMGWLTVGLAAFVTISYLVIKAFDKIKENSPEGQLKKATEQVNRFKSALEEVTQTTEALKSSWDEYTSVSKQLKTVKEKTQEWNEALLKNNQIVLDLIEKYPELLDYMTNTNGQLSIDQSGYEKVLKTQIDRQLKLQNSTLLSQQNIDFVKLQTELTEANQKKINEFANSDFPVGATLADIENVLSGEQGRQEFISKWHETGNSDERINRELNRIFELSQDSEFQRIQQEYQAVEDRYLNALSTPSTAAQNVADNMMSIYGEEENINNPMIARLLAKNVQGSIQDWKSATAKSLDYDSDDAMRQAFQENYSLSDEEAKKYTDEDIAFQLAQDKAAESLVENSQKQFESYNIQDPLMLAALRGDLSAVLGLGYNKNNLQLDENTINYLEDVGLTAQDILDGLESSSTIAVKSVAELDEEAKELDKTYAKLKTGDTTEKISDNLRSFFTQMEDGTYKLVADAEEFKDAVFREKISGRLDAIQGIQQNVADRQKFNSNVTMTEAEQADYYSNISAVLMSADSLTQLQAATDALNKLNVEATDIERLRGQALLDLASHYTTCADEIEQYRFALTTNNEELIKSIEATLEYSIQTAELAEKMSLQVDDIEDQARAFSKENEELKKNIENLEDRNKVATTMAALNQSMNKGVATLAKNWTDWNKILQTGDKTSQDYIDVIQGMRGALKNLVGILDDDFIPKDFLDAPENIALIEKAAKGDTQAINELGIALAQANIEAMEWSSGMQQMGTEGSIWNITESQFENYKAEVLEGITALNDAITNGAIEAGQDVTDLMDGNYMSWATALNNMAIATLMSVDEMKSMLNSLGVDADITTIQKKVPQSIPIYHTTNRVISGDPGNPREPWTTETSTIVDRYEPIESTIEVAQINMGDKKGTPPTIHYAGRSTPSNSAKTSGSKSGGGGKGKSSSSKKETKTAERYKTVNDQIEKIKDSYDDANKEADRLFGASRWAEIEKENQLLEKQNDLLGKKREEALQYLNKDKNNLLAAAEAAGIKLEFDENGIISNYRSAFEEYYARYNASEQTDEQKEILKKLEDALKQYDDTRKIIQDIENEQIDNNHKIQDNNFTITKEVIDIRKEVEANRLQNIQNQMNILGDDWPKVVEVFGLLTSQYATLSDGIMNIDTSKLTDLNAQFDDFTNETARARYGLNNIIEGLKMTQEEAQSTLDALLSWNKAMSEYYNNALSKYTDGLNFLTKQIDHAYNQLEHYNKMLSLWGKENDYRAQDIILRGQLNVANNNKLVAEDNYYMLEQQLIAAREAFNNASDEEARQAIYNSLLKPAEEAFEDAANTLWSAQEKYAEIAKAVYENLQAEAKQAAELALTAGKGFDALKESMDLASKYQDEYLTKTNQIYETEKLLRDINKDIDKTDNLASKSRLKNFADEITAMKEQGQLSQLELKIAQARYAQLQAQIALEEAQNAKSTVRLQRDNEGNYGYVYTADANQIGEAEQNLADKTNDLYNLVLENSNNYAQKMIELRQSTIDQLAALDKDAEDYEERKKEIMDRAMALYKTYSTEYGIAMHWLGVEAATDTNEAWTTEFIDPATYSLENFRDNITEYMNTSEDNFKEFQETLENDEMTKESLNDLANKVNDVTTATDDLKEAAQDYVANGSNILDQINAETVAWAEAQQAVLDYASALADLAKRSGETAANLGLEDTDYSLKMWETYLNGGNMSQAMSLRDTKIKNNPDVYTDQLNTQDVADLIKNYSVLGFSMGMTQDQMDRELRELGFKGIKKKYSLDTGGYTGSWGSDGRLAMLHEKELVLNKDDTKNFLAGIEILRSITGAIDLQAAVAGTATPISTPGFNLGGQTLQQSVTISAEFPNATNHSEIEEAFNNLINRASQYAHRQSFYNQV